MPRYAFTQRALADLKEIARYTRKTWGLKQARLYRKELELNIQKLALSPDMGHLREEVTQSVRSFRVARHIAFYVAGDAGITVLRILHPSMDVVGAFLDDDGS